MQKKTSRVMYLLVVLTILCAVDISVEKHMQCKPNGSEMEELAVKALSSGTLLIIAALIITRFLMRRRSSATSMPPSPLQLPVIGHLHLLTDMPHHAFAELARRLGPIIYLQLGRVPTVVVSSPEVARQVLKTHDHVFANRPQLLSAQYLSFRCSDVTFSRYGAYWRQARKICVSELLSHKRVASFQIVRDEEVNRLISTLRERSGRETELGRLLFSLANNVLCRVAFGRRVEREETKTREKKELVDVLTETQQLFAGFNVGEFFPEWKWVNSVVTSSYTRRLEKNLKDLIFVCEEIIKQHAERRHDGSECEDFVDVLLRAQARDDLEVPISDDNLKALVLDMFVAGTDTTAATMEWAMTELSLHPKAMATARREIEEVLKSTGEEEVGEKHLHRLPYLKAVTKETLRLHPPAPLLVPRESMDRCVLGGYEIPANTRVLINAYSIGRDPQWWTDNPLGFVPERFLNDDDGDGEEMKRLDFRFVPFGGGRRGCPGSVFGLATAEIALARLLSCFHWSLPDGISASGVDMRETFGLAARKKAPLVLVPETLS